MILLRFEVNSVIISFFGRFYFVLLIFLFNIMFLVFKIDEIVCILINVDVDIVFFMEIWLSGCVFDFLINIKGY